MAVTLRQATTIGMLMLLTLTFNANLTAGRKHYVGDDHHWTYMTSNWPIGKRFYAGDILVFKYNPEDHNVMRVNAYDYALCRVSVDPSKVYQSGNDHIKLKRGNNYFICGISGHCNLGMKILVRAI